MAKTRQKSSRNIVVGDMIRRHPAGLICKTDMAYTELANRIYNIISDKLPQDFTQHETKEISADIAAYIEDRVSGTHLFEAFQRLYRRMFNHELPFYDDVDASSAQFRLNAMRFVVWHSIMSQNPHNLINPLNKGVRMVAEGVLEFLDDILADLPSNEDLADYLYGEETQTDPIEVKKVLIWLMHDCYLGHWPLQESHEDALRILLNKKASDRMINYADRSITAFDCRAWPLSLKPQSIYAEMIRIDMGDDEDELAQAINDMVQLPLGLYHIVSYNNRGITVQDYKRQLYQIAMGSFDYNPKSEIERGHFTDVIASFITMDKKIWHVNGVCSFTHGTEDDFDAYCNRQIKHQESTERRRHQFDDIIEQHHGERLFFFKNRNAYTQWLKRDLGLKNVDDVDMSPLPNDSSMTVFIDPSGNMAIGFYPEAIKHPDNPLYDQVEARETALVAFLDSNGCTSAMAQYLIKNNLLPDAMLNDAQGMERGKTLLQENIEFLARCIRRDIDCNEPLSTRKGIPVEGTTTDITGKMSYNEFIDKILDLDGFRSKLNKQWYLLDASETITIVEDELGNQFSIPTREMYEAHLHLAMNQITNKTVEPFISMKKDVPPATAILHNVAGTGALSSMMREMMRKLGKAPL